MPLFILSILLQIALVVHIVRTGRNTTWIWIVVMLPLAGSVAYFLLEVLPDLMKSATGRSVSRKLSKSSDPVKDLKEAISDYSVTDTIERSMNLAGEFLKKEMYPEARSLYEKCLHEMQENDPALMHGLAQAEFGLEKYEAACETLESLIKLNPEFKNPDAHLLYAQVQEALGNEDAAMHEFEVLHGYYPGPEASYRYALLCKKLGNAELAAEIFTGIVGNAKNASKQYSAIHRRWLRLAESELKN